MTIMFMVPPLGKLLNLRFQGDVMEYVRMLTNGIIAQKRKDYANGSGLGKAYSFIEILLEAEIENDVELTNGKSVPNGTGNGHVANGSTGESGVSFKKSKCKFSINLSSSYSLIIFRLQL